MKRVNDELRRAALAGVDDDVVYRDRAASLVADIAS
jgi:hypothetical protein